MSKIFKIRRGTKSEIDSTIIPLSELIHDYDNNDIYLGTNSGNKKITVGSIYDVKNPPSTLNAANGDGITDDAPAIQALVDYVKLHGGGTILFPSGNYLINSSIIIDQSSETIYKDNTKINIIGEGSSSTKISVGGSFYAFTFRGDNNGAAFLLDTIVQGFRIVPLNPKVGSGLKFEETAFNFINDVVIIDLLYGINCQDFFSSRFINVKVRFCSYGAAFLNKVNLANPNAIDLFGCHFGSCDNYGLLIQNGTAVNFYGGSIEANGQTGSDSVRYGVKVEGGGASGYSGVKFFGTYFENNAGKADLWIVADGTNPLVNVVEGCSFLRSIASPAPYNIQVDQGVSDADLHINVSGCGFKGVSPYTPSTATPYIKLFTSADTMLNTNNNVYGDVDEFPTTQSNELFALARYNASTDTLVRNYNVKSVTKNSTGNFTLNFKKPVKLTTPIIQATCNGGIAYLINQTSDSVTIQTDNLSGVATDFTFNMINVYI